MKRCSKCLLPEMGNYLRELIFVDANIFVDHASANPSYGESCEEFLEKVESKNIIIRYPENRAKSEFVYIPISQHGNIFQSNRRIYFIKPWEG